MSLERALLVLLLGGGLLLGNVLIFLSLRKGRLDDAALDDFAAARGWRVERDERGARGDRTLIVDPATGRSLGLYRGPDSTDGSGRRTARWTEYHDPRPAIPAGLAVLGPPLPDKTVALAGSTLGGSISGALPGRVLMGSQPDIAADVGRLERVRDRPAAHGTLFATPEAREALDPVLGHPAFGPAREGRNEMQQPIVQRGPFGLRVRIRRWLNDPGELAALADFGEALSGTLRR